MEQTTDTDRSQQLHESIPEPLQSPAALHDPFEWYDTKRATAPVQYDPKREVYDVFSYTHVKAALQDSDRLVRKPLEDSHGETPNPFSYIDTAMVWSDGPGHKAAKGQLFKYFRPTILDGLTGSIEAIADDQLRVALEDGPTFDFVEEFAVPVPLRVIMDVVGVPQQDHHQLLEWLETFREVMYSEYSAVGSTDGRAMSDAVTYIQQLVDNREQEPKDDLISQLVTETELSHEEIGSNCFDFILAGQGTMSELLSNALYVFVDQGLFADLEEYDLSVVLEEVLRYRSSLQSRARKTVEAVELGGTRIPSGETVILWIGAANRDPTQFDRPHEFIPDRDPDHLAFGNGPHACIGAPLARLEAPIIMQTVVDQFDEIDIDTEAMTPKAKASKLGFERLPVTAK